MVKIYALFHEFNKLLSPFLDPTKKIVHRPKFFMLRALHKLLLIKYSYIRDQILDFPVVPTLTSTYSTLFRVQKNPTFDTLLLLMILLHWHLTVMTRLALANREKAVLSVNIVAS